MPKNVKLDALTEILKDAEEVSIEVEMGDSEGSDKCDCGADMKCAGCGKAPSECDC